MSVLDLLRKVFGYVLLSMGVSRPQEKRESRRQEPDKPESERLKSQSSGTEPPRTNSN
jgi:hypothetical protein